jgi:GNAT superfamily N-acetyltransferase
VLKGGWQVRVAEDETAIVRCFPVMLQLRPHLAGAQVFAEQVLRQMRDDGYRLACVEDRGEVCAVAGFRLQEMLSRGRFVYVDDLVTDAERRSSGYGAFLLDWLVDFARSQGCRQLDLDSGVQRFDAHRFYFRQGLHISTYHFTIALNG